MTHMWMIRNKDGEFVGHSAGLSETDEMVALIAGQARGRPFWTSIKPRTIIYEDASLARQLKDNMYVLFNKDGKQLCVGTLEECDIELSGLTGDCARAKMEYPFGYYAIWVDKPEDIDYK